MEFYILAILLLLLTVIFLFRRLDRKKTDILTDKEFYSRQLNDIESHIESDSKKSKNDLWNEERTIIGRQLLETSDKKDIFATSVTNATNVTGDTTKRFFYVIAVSFPILVLSVYLTLGSPNFNDTLPLDQQSLEVLLQKTERVLQDHPNDARGWWILAQTYDSLQRYAERDRALSQLERIKQEKENEVSQ